MKLLQIDGNWNFFDDKNKQQFPGIFENTNNKHEGNFSFFTENFGSKKCKAFILRFKK